MPQKAKQLSTPDTAPHRAPAMTSNSSIRLLSLPDELIAVIMGNLVQYQNDYGQYYIYVAATHVQKPRTRSTADKPRRRTPVQKAKAAVLAPIYAIGNKKLIAIAEDEFYLVNVFRAVLKPFRSLAGIEPGFVAGLPPHKKNGVTMRL